MASLLAATGPHAGARFEIGEELAIGRAAVCQVCLAEDGKVSRRHARVLARSGLHLLVDLGSRNGTLLNGERIQGEAPLQPGDRIQVGDTLFVFDVPLRASVEESAEQVQRAEPAEQVLPSGGEASAVLRAATALVSCQSEAAVLRRGAEEARRALRADLAAALLPGELGLATAAVVGASEVKVPRALMRAADRREVARMGSAAIAPLWIGGSGLGALYVERQSEAMAGPELGLLASLGRLMGEAIAAARTRVPPPTEGVLVGSSRVFRRALAEVRRAAARSETAILIGEPGTGKALVAHYLHARSPRALGPFVQVDCRAPTPQLAEELWGRAAGAGGPPRPSALSRADGGTLVLLAAEALPHELAARLARELSGLAAAHPPGAGETAADVRLVATVRESVAVLAAGGHLAFFVVEALIGRPLPERVQNIFLWGGVGLLVSLMLFTLYLDVPRILERILK